MILVSYSPSGMNEFRFMMFSKSFGYGIRSILYLALLKDEKPRVRLDEIAEALNIPRYFLGKVLNRLVKEGLLDSAKGHNGGFSINERSLSTKLSVIAELTNEGFQPGECVLHLGACNRQAPCGLHDLIQPLKQQWNALLMSVSVETLLATGNADILNNIVATRQSRKI
jgi:Rrf2 family transcriptional regulator, iron-sulfur cluster assembly transcription factor